MAQRHVEPSETSRRPPDCVLSHRKVDFTLRQFYVYIMTNKSGTLYIGVTNDLQRRVYEHKTKFISGFTSRYNLNRLVYFEDYTDIRQAIAREKQVKDWLRKKKIELIDSINPKWEDLSLDWNVGDSSLRSE